MLVTLSSSSLNDHTAERELITLLPCIHYSRPVLSRKRVPLLLRLPGICNAAFMPLYSVGSTMFSSANSRRRRGVIPGTSAAREIHCGNNAETGETPIRYFPCTQVRKQTVLYNHALTARVAQAEHHTTKDTNIAYMALDPFSCDHAWY